MKNKLLLLLIFVSCCFSTYAQVTIGGGIVNRYAQITSISGNTLTLGSQTGAAHTWAVGDFVMITQMTGSTTSGGGLFQIAKITAVSGSTITISGALRPFDSPTVEKIQAVWVPYSTTGWVTSGTITSYPWDGTLGGIVALKTSANLQLNGAIITDGQGFRPTDTQTVYGEGLYGGGGGAGSYGGGGGGYSVSSGITTTQNSGIGGGSPANSWYGGTNQAGGTSNGTNGGGGSGSANGTSANGGTHNGGAGNLVVSGLGTQLNGGGGGGGSYGGGGGGSGYGGGGGGASPALAGCGGGVDQSSTTFAGATNGSGWQNATAAGGGGGGFYTGGSGGSGPSPYFGGYGGGFVPTSGYKNFMNTSNPRLFMGGAGSGLAINGGGIILLDASTIGSVNNFGYAISANGADGLIGGSSGTLSFGAGAGGNILITGTATSAISTSAKGGNGVGGVLNGPYSTGASGGGGGGGVWVMASTSSSNVNSLASNPTVSNVSFNVSGGVASPRVCYTTKYGKVCPMAGCGGSGIAVADYQVCNTYMKSIGLCTSCLAQTAPILSQTSVTNICPASFASLNSIVSNSCDANTALEWHTVASGFSANNKVSTPSVVSAGNYYPVCYDAANDCYGPLPTPIDHVTVTINSNCPAVDLITQITPDPLKSTIGTNATYTVSVCNIGNLISSGAMNEVITLPVGVSYVSGGGNGWNLVSQSGQTLTFNNSSTTIASNNACSTFPLVVTPNNVGNYTLPVSISGGNDGNTSNNTAVGNLVVSGVPDLTTSISPSNATTTTNTAFVYTVSVQNSGSATAAATLPATETITLPADLTFISGGGNGWNLVSQNGQTLTFTNINPNLAIGGSTGFPLVVYPTVATTYNIPVAVSGGGETNTSNNTSSAILIASAPLNPADLTTVISPSTYTGAVNTPVNYMIDVTNLGQSATSGLVTETITLPSGLTYVSGGNSSWSIVSNNNGVLTFANPNLILTTGNTSSFPLVVSSATAGTFTIPVSVSGGVETNYLNNSSSATLIINAPNMQTAITPVSNSVVLNTPVNFNVTARNVGNTTSVGSVSQVITLPANVTYVSGGGNGWNLVSNQGQLLTFSNSAPNLSQNSTSTFPLVLTPTVAGSYNVDVAVSGGGEVITTDNTASANIVALTPTTTLSLVKSQTAISGQTVGSTITYNLVVTNTGNVTLTNVNVVDANATINSGNPISSLAAGASATITATHTISQTDINQGYVSNTATATGTTPTNGTVSSISDTGTDVSGNNILSPSTTDSNNDGNPLNDPTVTNLVPQKLALLPKVWLQGSLFGVTSSTGVMRDDLRVAGLLPTSSPYPALGFVEKTSTGSLATSLLSITDNNAITDWVWVELRSATDPTQVVDSRSALVQRDGDIVDLDGISEIKFNTTTAANYYVAVKHRNHLGVMTKSPIALSSAAATVDFRTSSTPVFTLATNAINQAQVVVNQGVALWAGNTIIDDNVIFQGNSNDVNSIYTKVINATNNTFVTPFYIFKSYNNSDVNMDGNVIFQGTGNDVNYIYQNVLANHPGNTLKVNYFIIKEQLP